MAVVEDAEELRKPSLRLRIAAGYFRVVGILGLAGIALVLGTIIFIGAPFSALTQRPLELMAGVVMCVGMILAGTSLRKRRRSAGIAALASFILPLFTSGGMASRGALIATAVGLAVIASVWKELTE